ncbi:uncharacterized protein LOC143987648 [Lithobates pipiens]
MLNLPGPSALALDIQAALTCHPPVLQLHHAKAEAGCALASYAIREAEIREQGCIDEENHMIKAKSKAEALRGKAEVKASLHIIKQERTASAGLAEAEVLMRAAEEQYREHSVIDTQMTPLSAIQRISEYVQLHTTMCTDQQSNDALESSKVPLAADNFDIAQCYKTEPELYYNKPSSYILRDQSVGPSGNRTNGDIIPPLENINPAYSRKTCSKLEQPHNYSGFNQAPPPSYQPQTCPVFVPTKCQPEAAGATDVTKYLICREMVSFGLLKFDDHPENYWAWKSSFLSSTQDLNQKDREKLDLLSKWLRPESTGQAKRIRSVRVHDATTGLTMLWQRLLCYYLK